VRGLGGAGMIYHQHRNQQPSPPSPPTPAQPQRTHEGVRWSAGARWRKQDLQLWRRSYGGRWVASSSSSSILTLIVIGIRASGHHGTMAPWHHGDAHAE